MRSRKVTAPPTRDTLESLSKLRVMQSEKTKQENEDVGVKKIRAQSHRGCGNV